ncbi:MAG: AbgT family transporter, partial [Sedimentibacter sp.]
DLSNVRNLATKDILVLLIFGIGMGILIFGVFKYGWYITEIAAIFFGMGIVAGLVGGLKPDDIAKSFIDGARAIVTGALVVGLARGLLVIMEGSMIIDTVVHALASLISQLPKTISAIGMLLVQSFINFFIPSGSGQAATTMPIMSPLADVIGLTRQTAVLAYQFGDGISNSIIPTSGVLMANLSIARIKYEDWFKFVAPLMLIWTGMAAVFMVVAVLIDYGPF